MGGGNVKDKTFEGVIKNVTLMIGEQKTKKIDISLDIQSRICINICIFVSNKVSIPD